MWEFALVTLVALLVGVGAAMGLLCCLVAARTPIDKSVAFSWGMAFGPLGLIPMTMFRTANHPRVVDHVEQNRVGQPLAFIGVALSVAGVASPWFRASGIDREFTLLPLTTSVLRGGAWAVLVVLAIGVVVAATSGSVMLLGCAGAVVFNSALIVWFMGSRIIAILPADVVPIEAAITLGRGASISLLGGILIMISCLFTLIEQTWPGRIHTPSTRTVVIGLVATGLVVMVRDIAWVRFDTGAVSWGLPADALPLIGDALVLLLVIGAVTSAASIFHPARWLNVIEVCCGALVLTGSLLAALFSGVVNRAVDWLREQSPTFLGDSLETSTTRGPYITAVVGLVLCVHAVVKLAQSQPAVEARVATTGLGGPPAAPPAPF